MTNNPDSSYNSNLSNINDSADFWFYEIGVNIIPADTINKIPLEPWQQYQNESISTEKFELWKKEGRFDKGIALIPGKIWRGQYAGKYLVAVDLDNKKAIDEFCKDGLEELKQISLVEQTSNPEKMHIYFIVEREIPNKSSDKSDSYNSEKIDTNQIPAIEVKSNGKGIMFSSNSPHKNGSNYQIIGTYKPQIFKAEDVEERIGLLCQNYNISYGNGSGFNNKLSIEELFKPGTRILEGHNRHEALLRVMESLLRRNQDILTLDKIRELAYEWNQVNCDPPLDDKEFERQWKCAIRYVGKSIVEDNIKDENSQSKDSTGDTGDTGGNNSKTKTEEEDSSKSTAKIIVNLALESSKLFKNEFEQPHVLLNIDNHYEVLSLEGKKFEFYLSKLYYDNCDEKIASAEVINNVIRMLSAKAIFDCETIPLHLKVAWSIDRNDIYYDLCDEERRCIKIAKGEGWKIIDNQYEVLFKRFGHQSPQLEPLRDYNPLILEIFINSLNIKNENHKLLVKVWIISLLIPGIAKPILLPFGEKGSAKSTLLRKIKMLIDPSPLDLFSITYSKEEFIQQLSHHYLCFYDNVRIEPKWLSDEVCRATTGAAHSKRKLYSDDEDIPYRYKKILAFAGINVIFSEPDALDRSIRIELERIREEENIPDAKIEEDLKQMIPSLLGYILDILSKTLELKDSIKLDRLPRMADFAEWGEAIARAIGYKPLEFINAYFENIGEQNIEIIEANPFAYAISKFIDYEMTSWISSPCTLIKTVKEYAEDNNIDTSKFPKNPAAVSRRLNRIKSNLREGLGIEVIVERITGGKGNKKQMNHAIIKVRRIPPVAPVAPANQKDEGNKPEDTGGIQNSGGITSSESIIPPADKTLNHVQITSDINNTGGTGGTGGIVRNTLGESKQQPSKICKCYYCPVEFDTPEKHLKHSINAHPKEPAQPTKDMIEQMRKIQGRTDIEPKGNPWEI